MDKALVTDRHPYYASSQLTDLTLSTCGFELTMESIEVLYYASLTHINALVWKMFPEAVDLLEKQKLIEVGTDELALTKQGQKIVTELRSSTNLIPPEDWNNGDDKLGGTIWVMG